jgi:hypothetical protein
LSGGVRIALLDGGQHARDFTHRGTRKVRRLARLSTG